MIETDAYLNVCNCFSFSTVRTRVLPSLEPGGLPLTLTFLCEPDSLSDSIFKREETSNLIFELPYKKPTTAQSAFDESSRECV